MGTFDGFKGAKLLRSGACQEKHRALIFTVVLQERGNKNGWSLSEMWGDGVFDDLNHTKKSMKHVYKLWNNVQVN